MSGSLERISTRDAVGQRWCDHFSQAVPARDPGYIDYVLDLIARHDIKLVILGTEYEMEAFHRNRERLAETDAVIVLNRFEVIENTHDKWLAHGVFTKAGIPTIPSRIDGGLPRRSRGTWVANVVEAAPLRCWKRDAHHS